MEAVSSISEQGNILDSVEYLKDNKLEALKSLALLLLREVENLHSVPDDAEGILAKNGLNLLERTQKYEEELIRAALIKTGGNQRKAAKLLGTKETTLNVKVKRYGIDLANQNSRSKK